MINNLILLATETTQAAAGEEAPPLMKFMNFFPIVIIAFLIIYMFRAQGKEKKRREEMLNSVKMGDKVITVGGIHGEITSVKEKTFVVKIADNVKIEVAKNGVNTISNNE